MRSKKESSRPSLCLGCLKNTPMFPLPSSRLFRVLKPSTLSIVRIVRHHRVEHPDATKPSSWATGPAQRFTEGVGVFRQVFRVLAPVVDSNVGTFNISSILANMEATQKALTPDLDIRNITPWLRITKWHEMIEGHDVAYLRSLVSVPTLLEFPILQKAVLSMLMDASDLIDETTTLVLQLLNSPDPTKECVLSYLCVCSMLM
jgi:hypothetical protein